MNNKKRWGRRLGIGIGATILVSIAFYIEIFTGKVGIEPLKAYIGFIALIAGLLIPTLTVTDYMKVKRENEQK